MLADAFVGLFYDNSVSAELNVSQREYHAGLGISYLRRTANDNAANSRSIQCVLPPLEGPEPVDDW